MITFVDGPAKGTSLQLHCAPYFLRVVTNSKGVIDALDQLHDIAAADESITVYRLINDPTMVHVRRAKGRGGFYVCAEYRMHDTQPSDKTARASNLWWQWCKTQPNPRRY